MCFSPQFSHFSTSGIYKNVIITGNGLQFYLFPKWSLLLQPEIWIQAATQILFSSSPAFGILITFGSYLPQKTNTVLYAIIVNVTNCLTSLFSGLVVFSFLGYMAHVKDVSIDEVATAGPGLAFVVYPEALSIMPLSQFFSALFFLTLLLLGFDR